MMNRLFHETFYNFLRAQLYIDSFYVSNDFSSNEINYSLSDLSFTPTVKHALVLNEIHLRR